MSFLFDVDLSCTAQDFRGIIQRAVEFCAIDEATRVSGAGTLGFRLLTNRLKRDQDRSLKTVAFLGVIIQVHIYIYGRCPIFLCPSFGPWSALARTLRALACTDKYAKCIRMRRNSRTFLTSDLALALGPRLRVPCARGLFASFIMLRFGA